MAVYIPDDNEPPNLMLILCLILCMLFWFHLTNVTLKLIYQKGVSHEFKK